MRRQTTISNHVIQFARFLRNQQYPIGPNEEADALSGLAVINWSDHKQFKEVLRATFCKHFEQYQHFDKYYEQYWAELKRSVDSKTKQVAEERPKPQKASPPSLQVIKNWLHGNREKEIQDIHQGSDEAASVKPDLSALREHHLREWEEVVRLIQRYVAKQKSRRWVSTQRKEQLDLRKLLKSSIARGGEISVLTFKKQKKNKANILFFCDVSRSMELYSRFMIQMMYAIQNSALKVNCYVFSTSLFPISKLLKKQSLPDALEAISDQVEGWSGGTKIGESLQEFVHQEKRKVMTRHTFTFILSDGWDAGEIKALSNAMNVLQRHSKKLFWINPLAGNQSYKPQVLGMKTAMPYIDHFIPALDIKSLISYLKISM